MKIHLVVSKLSGGGAERVVSILANYFHGQGHEVAVITFTGEDTYPLNPGIKRVKLHRKRLLKYVVFNGFINLLGYYRHKKNRPDIICAHVGMMGYVTVPAAKLYGIKLIISEHFNHLLQPKTFQKKFLWNVLYRFPDAVTVLTALDLPFFESRTKKVLVMENPCTFEKLEDFTLPREKTLLAVGNLDRYYHKGFDNLITIAANVLTTRPNWKLRIVGGGEQGMQVLKKLVAQHGMESQVVFEGFRNDVKHLMATSEIYVMTSRHEGLPMVLLEAMSQGMVCISFDCISGPADIISHNVDGILVENQHIEQMSGQLAKLMDNSNLREALRARIPESLHRFSLETVGKKWENLLQDTLNRKT